MGTFELVPDKYKYHVHFGQCVPESVLNKLKEGADDSAPRSDGDLDEEGLINTELGVCRKRERESNDGEDHSDEGGELLPKVSPSKKAKLDTSNPVPSTSVTSKPQQTSLAAFLKQKSSGNYEAGVKPMESHWEEKGSLLIMRFGNPLPSPKIASYDLDGTLIETASGRKFAKDLNDWKLMSKVAEKLQSLHRGGYKIAIISNQLGISKGKQPVGEFKLKAEAVAGVLKVPLLLLAATSRDMYRKPCVAMWDYMIKSENGGVAADLKESFYVGDAAGREANWKPGMYTIMYLNLIQPLAIVTVYKTYTMSRVP